MAFVIRNAGKQNNLCSCGRG